MASDLEEKTDRYEALLADALSTAQPSDEGADDCLEMAASYLDDGRHFREEGDPVNALASFSYGHGWLDAGARMGVLSVPHESDLFTV